MCSDCEVMSIVKSFDTCMKISSQPAEILTSFDTRMKISSGSRPSVKLMALTCFLEWPPVYEKRLFEKRTGMKEVMFDKLIKNIDYASNNLYNPNLLLLHINGINEHSNIIKLKNFPDLEKNEMQNQVAIAQKLFPSIKIYEQWNLVDRAGLLKDVMLNKIPEGEVIGCSVKRDTEWLHISPKGDVFLCCNDLISCLIHFASL